MTTTSRRKTARLSTNFRQHNWRSLGGKCLKVSAMAAVFLPFVTSAGASTITWDGGGIGGVDLDAAANWVGDALPTTSDEVLFDNSVIAAGSYPTALLNSTTSQTWGSIIWNNSQSGVALTMTGSGGNKVLTLSAGGGSAAAIAAGGASGDILLLGSAFTSGTFSISGTNGTGNSRLTLTLPNITGNYNVDVVNAGATLVFGSTTNGATAANTTITKTGAGTLSFSNGNIAFFTSTATGRKFILDQGTLNVTSNASIGGSTLEIHGGTTLDNSGASTGIALTSSAQSWTGDFTFAGTGSGGLSLTSATNGVTLSGSGSARQVTVSASSLTVAGPIKGTGYGLTKAGAGTLTLSGANTYDGITTVNAGILSLAAGGSLNTATSLVVNGGATASTAGTFDLGGQNQTIVALSGGSGTVSGKVRNNGANSTATLTVTGTSTFDGQLINGPSAPATRILALVKSTGGILTLTGASTYTGGTTVSGGELRLDNVTLSATGTGQVLVSGGIAATLSGTGIATGLTDVSGGSRLAPGNNTSGNFGSGGSLGLGTTGGLTLTDAHLDFDLDTTAAAATNDLINTAALSLGSSIAFTFNGLGGSLETGSAYTLINASSAAGFDVQNISTTFLGALNGAYSATYSVDGNNDLLVTFAAIPEPSSAIALLGGLGLLLGLRRFRFRVTA